MRQQSILKKGISFVPFTLYSSRDERYTLDTCLRHGCTMETVVDRVMMCPTHSTIHYCDESTCNRYSSSGEKYCAFSLRSREAEDFIEDDAFLNRGFEKEGTAWNPSQVVSYPQTSSSSSKHKEHTWYIKEQTFKTVVGNIIGKLCNPSCRNSYNKNILRMRSISAKNTLKKVSPWDLGMLILLERDLTKLCMSVLEGATKKKSRKFLLENAPSFIFVVMKTFLSGLSERGQFLLKPPHYAQRLTPLPKKKLVAEHFGLNLLKFSRCLKFTQNIFEGKMFRSYLQRAFYSSGK